MDKDYILNELKRNKEVYLNLLSDISEELIHWKPSEDKWNLLEIVCHLYDEEREDFRQRTDIILNNPEMELPPIDPQGWVKSRKYSENNFNEMLEKFIEERNNSIKFVKSLINPNWKNSINHKIFGKVTAEYFYYNWAAHDYLHIRQIINQKLNYLKYKTGNPLSYAG